MIDRLQKDEKARVNAMKLAAKPLFVITEEEVPH
jgi:hypothetical protein